MGAKVQHGSNVLTNMRGAVLSLLLALLPQPGLAKKVNDVADSLSIDGVLVHVEVEDGKLELSFVAADLAQHPAPDQFRVKVMNLQQAIRLRMRDMQHVEQRQFDSEQLSFRARRHVKSTLEKVSLLQDRMQLLVTGPDQAQQIEAAALAFDLPEIIRLLREKVAMEDSSLAEAAFQLGSFQELQGEYQDAWANYQKASNLQPGNQLYMDAHGKNQF